MHYIQYWLSEINTIYCICNSFQDSSPNPPGCSFDAAVRSFPRRSTPTIGRTAPFFVFQPGYPSERPPPPIDIDKIKDPEQERRTALPSQSTRAGQQDARAFCCPAFLFLKRSCESCRKLSTPSLCRERPSTPYD